MYNQESDGMNQERHHDIEQGKTVIPVLEERLIVDRKTIESGKVIISKMVQTEEQEVAIPVVEENVEVERIPYNEYIDSVPAAVRYEGDKTIIPILKEVLVVEKRLMLVEEIHITRQKNQQTVTQRETLRKEELNINRENTDPASI